MEVAGCASRLRSIADGGGWRSLWRLYADHGAMLKDQAGPRDGSLRHARLFAVAGGGLVAGQSSVARAGKYLFVMQGNLYLVA